jgi:hypothetical protein
MFFTWTEIEYKLIRNKDRKRLITL